MSSIGCANKPLSSAIYSSRRPTSMSVEMQLTWPGKSTSSLAKSLPNTVALDLNGARKWSSTCAAAVATRKTSGHNISMHWLRLLEFFFFFFSDTYVFYIIVFLSGLFPHLDDIAYIPPPDSVPYIFFSHSARTMYVSFLTSCDEDLVISMDFFFGRVISRIDSDSTGRLYSKAFDKHSNPYTCFVDYTRTLA